MPDRRALGSVARTLTLAAAALAAGASASNPPQPYGPAGGGGYGQRFQPPSPEPMTPELATGLYDSSFGAVKIEHDPQGQGPEDVVGVWVYDRDGQEVVGLFEGTLDGNVLEFAWEEPTDGPPLTGGGFLVFHRDGSGFYGKWWTDDNTRTGDWTGDKYRGDGPSGPAEQAPPDGYEDGHYEDDPYYDDGSGTTI